MKTKYKVLIAKILFKLFSILKFSQKRQVKRNGIYWEVDLSEAIDLSIFLFGKFEYSVIKTANKIIDTETYDIIDIGANIGSQTLVFAKTFKNSKIYAIEPSDYSYLKLKKNILLNKDLTPRIDDTQAFITNQKDKPSEVYSSWNLNSKLVSHKDHKGIKTSTEKSKTLTLDNFIDKKKILKKILIKLDVDGTELNVLKSGENYLKTQKPPIIMELAPYLYPEYGYNSEHLLNFIVNLGYDFYNEEDIKKIEDIKKYISKIKHGSSKNILILSK